MNQGIALYEEALSFLSQLIEIPSFSREEAHSADFIETFLGERGVETYRSGNNVWAWNSHYDASKESILLNSHHDTVKPAAAYSKDPFKAVFSDEKLYGLGSNDAGASLASLMATFLYFHKKGGMKYNILFAASAEEEISGANGIESILPRLGKIAFGIVGEPTSMTMAVAEKGLLVLDCISRGVAAHAAHNRGVNAIYRAMQDIHWFSSYTFPKVSELLGSVKMNVTMINAGTQHNMLPDECRFTVDIRLNELYTHEELINEVQNNVSSEVKARSTRLRSSSIELSHPLVKAGMEMKLGIFGSSTLSDKALMPFPALKLGPGDTCRSHTADEFIYISELRDAIDKYISLIGKII